MGAIPSIWRGRDRHRGREAAMGFFPLGITQQRCSASLVVRASSTSIPFAELLPPSCPLRMSPHSQPQSSAWFSSPNPTFQHPALVCSGGHPLRLGGQGWGQYPVYRSHSVLLPQTVAMFSSHREGSPSVPTELTPAPVDKNSR